MEKKKFINYLALLCSFLLSDTINVSAQNPFILDQYTADPSARVFEDKVYVYPSHDIPCGEGQGMIGFCMRDYHVFSSENLTDWVDHGVIVNQENVKWVDSTSYSMWAPDCIFRNGNYYFYFPAIAWDKSEGRGRRVGVAVSDSPYGPFLPEPGPMKGVYGIDPNPFIDNDGQAYLYWAASRRIYMAKLKENMLETESGSWEIAGLTENFKEGPYLFERRGIYYLTFPYVADSTEQIVYAMADNPTGPFIYKGIIMYESPTKCWTNHQSILEYTGQWYLFYHHNDLSPDFDKNRSIRADSLFFNSDGTIQKVIPTLRGVGLTDARKKIQIDRYSFISETGASISFLDTLNRQQGWKTILSSKGAWIKYNSVDFGTEPLNSVFVKAYSKASGTLDIRIDKTDGLLLARIKIEENTYWEITQSELLNIPTGIHNLIIQLCETNHVEIDWISFE